PRGAGRILPDNGRTVLRIGRLEQHLDAVGVELLLVFLIAPARFLAQGQEVVDLTAVAFGEFGCGQLVLPGGVHRVADLVKDIDAAGPFGAGLLPETVLVRADQEKFLGNELMVVLYRLERLALERRLWPRGVRAGLVRQFGALRIEILRLHYEVHFLA